MIYSKNTCEGKNNYGKFTQAFNRSTALLTLVYNVLRLCVCLPLAQSFNLKTNLMGQIAQNRCYAQCFFNGIINFKQ